jgi:ABC-type nitrate/sulfonate/bicarbonate transport system permease component
VGIAFGSVVGAIALGAAVALGVGGRHVAGKLLEEAVQALRTEPPPSDAPPIRFPD